MPSPIVSVMNCAKHQNFRTPILLIVFNRPDCTRKALESIALVKPSRLYIAADGARCGNESDTKLCSEVLELVESNITWDCEVFRNIASENMGCGKRVSSAISWVFEHEELAIIVEDDLITGLDFYRFAEVMLDRYKDDSRVMHINGNTFGVEFESNYSYGFCRRAQVWGWATWKRAWDLYDFTFEYLDEVLDTPLALSFGQNVGARERAFKKWRRTQAGEIDTWDHQWHYTIFRENGLVVCPRVNLVSNIGFGPDATHTKLDRRGVAECSTGTLSFPLAHPPCMIPDPRIDEAYLAHMYAGADSQGKGASKWVKRFKKFVGM